MRSLILLLALCSSTLAASKYLISLNEENWTQLLQGEWMLEFHAPWCPACKDLQKAWNSFADFSPDLKIKVADVDVTTNPGLSGRFLVTALPTIYHVKDGVFRVYAGSRDKNDFISFIEDRRWRTLDPVPDYKHPNSAQMGIVAVFFKLSMAVRDLHNTLVEEKGLPSWASYSLFAAVTLLLGCVLGFLIVLVIDQIFPTGSAAAAKGSKKKNEEKGKKEEKTKKENNNDEKKDKKKADDKAEGKKNK